MILNNFEEICNYIDEDNKDYSYTLSIIRRGKDHPNLPSANYTIKSFFISGSLELSKYWDEIVTLCKAFKARAYINLYKVSNRKCIETTIKNCAERLLQTDCVKPERIWWKSIAEVKPEKKLWVIDCDSKDKWNLGGLLKYVKEKSQVELVLPTIQGYHIVCTPFNSIDFPGENFNSEIKKQGLTLLYYDTLED